MLPEMTSDYTPTSSMELDGINWNARAINQSKYQKSN